MTDRQKWALEQAMDARDRINNVIEMLEDMSAQGGEDAPRAGTWISVKDRLPRTGRSVLVYVRRDDGVDTWYRTIAWMGEKNWDSCDPYFSQNDTITHWMSLPEPPKGDDE